MIGFFRKRIEVVSRTNPAFLLGAGYLFVGAIGTLILALPFVEKVRTSFIDNLFVAPD